MGAPVRARPAHRWSSLTRSGRSGVIRDGVRARSTGARGRARANEHPRRSCSNSASSSSNSSRRSRSIRPSISPNRAGVEAQILLSRELAEPIEPVARLERHQVHEVASLSASEHREHLVDRQLLAGERRRETAGLGREEARVRRQVELGAIVAVHDDQPDESGVHLHVTDDETCGAQGATDSWKQLVDGIAGEAEEVEVAGLPSNVTPRDQRGAARERETLRFVQAGDELGNPLLKRTEHLLVAETGDPDCPSLPNAGGRTSSSQSSSSCSAST